MSGRAEPATLALPDSLEPIASPDFTGINAKLGLLRDPIAELQAGAERALEEGRPYICLVRNGRKAILPLLPDTMWAVLRTRDNTDTFSRGDSLYFLQNLVQDAVFFVRGQEWEAQRKEAVDVLASDRYAGIFSHMKSTADELMTRWTVRVSNGLTLEAGQEFAPYTLSVLCRALFDTERPEAVGELNRSLRALFEIASRRSYFPVIEKLIPRDFAQTVFPKVKRSIEFFQDLADGIIAQRLEESLRDDFAGRYDLLSVMVRKHLQENRADPDGGSLNKLRQKVMTYVVAGHETTSNALIWIFYSLAKHPEWQQKIFEEIGRVVGDRDLAYADLKNLEIMRAVVDEDFRLYPPFWMFRRFALKDTLLPCGDSEPIQLRKNMTVLISPYLMHRNARLWDDAGTFNPPNFRPEAVKERNVRFRGQPPYIPFGGGDHSCVGQQFAIAEILVTLERAVRRFKFSFADPDYEAKPHAAITMSPVQPVRLIAVPRQATPAYH
jgi:cytochrome P450